MWIILEQINNSSAGYNISVDKISLIQEKVNSYAKTYYGYKVCHISSRR